MPVLTHNFLILGSLFVWFVAAMTSFHQQERRLPVSRAVTSGQSEILWFRLFFFCQSPVLWRHFEKHELRHGAVSSKANLCDERPA